MQRSNGFNVALVSIPFSLPQGDPDITTIEILAGACDELFITTGTSYMGKVISGENVHIHQVPSVSLGQHWLIRFLKYIPVQLNACANLRKISKDIDIVVFYAGGISLTLPLLFAKLLRKKVVLLVAGSDPKIARKMYGHTLFGMGGLILSYAFRAIERTGCTLSDKIIVGSERLVRYFEIERYRRKIIISNYCQSYINSRFKVKKDWHQRGNVVGYVGRLSREKGVVEIARAIPLILSKKQDVKFLIVGEGLMREEMEKELEHTGCLDKVEFAGWVLPDVVADYLNEMKFHILPSHSEAEGRTNLEAMACGTISIVNSVGGLPDFVTDGETGFLLKDNQPQTIAEKIIEVWEHPDLGSIRERAQSFIEENLSYERAVESWRQIFANL